MKRKSFFIFCHLLFLMFFVRLLKAETPNMQYIQGKKSEKQKLSLSLSGDIQIKYGSAGSEIKNQIYLRELELGIYTPLNDKIYTQLNLAIHLEDGAELIEIHEAVVGTHHLFPRARAKFGKYFLGIGRLNRTHRHEWPFISAPKFYEELFGEEGMNDIGFELNYLFPTPFFWDLTLGVSGGQALGHGHGDDHEEIEEIEESGLAQFKVPLHYLRSSVYFSLPAQGGAQLGINYLGFRDAEGDHFHFGGIDLIAKWKRSKRLVFLLQSELWAKIIVEPNSDSSTHWGTYIYSQYGLNERWSLGVRGDYFSSPEEKQWAVIPKISYQWNERMRLSVAYHGEYEKNLSQPWQWRHAAEFQMTFLVGKHPAHKF